MGTINNPPLLVSEMGSTPPDASQEYSSIHVAHAVSFKLRHVDPPSSLYIDRDDKIVVQCSTLLAAGDTFTVTVRLLVADKTAAPPGLTSPAERQAFLDGQEQRLAVLQTTLVLTTANTNQNFALDLAEGYLLSLIVTSASAVFRGQSYARAFVNRGTNFPTVQTLAAVLAADYVTSGGPLSWPYGRIGQPTEGPGVPTSTTVSTPAAGAEIVFNDSGLRRRRFLSMHAQLVTNATVINRTPKLRATDSAGNVLWEAGNNNAQAAGTTILYNWGAGVATTQVDPTTFIASAPAEFFLPTVGFYRTVTTNIQGTDQWSAIVLCEELWLGNS